MKLFVWEGYGVLQDYTCGMICVLAESLEDAHRLIKEKCDYAEGSYPPSQFKVAENPEAFICWGGS